MSSGHAFLAPSGVYQWGPGACPASARMQEQYPDSQESQESREGVAAHFAVTEPLAGRTVSIGCLAPNGHPIDQEMLDAGKEFIRDILDTVRSASPGVTLRIEERVDMSASIHAQCWGTPDVYFIDWPRKVVHLWDYKYGHRFVDEWRAGQGVAYFAGILECHDIAQEDWSQWRFTFTIGQPRNYHPSGQIREWHLDGTELLELVAQLRVAAEEATKPDAPMKTGPHCIDCTALWACPAAQRVGDALIDLSLRAEPHELDAAAIGARMTILATAHKRLKRQFDALMEQGLVMAQNGKPAPPGWSTDYSYGREKWTLSAPEVVALGRNAGVDLAKEVATITPAQARKVMNPDIVNIFSEKPRGAMTLVPFNDKVAAKAFSQKGKP